MRGWLLFLGILIGSIVLMRITGADHYVTLENLQAHTQYWVDLVEHHYGKAVIIYCSMSILSVLIGLPAVMPLSLLAGLLFGFYAGILYTMISVLIASVITFILFRFVLRSFLARRYASMLNEWTARINRMGTTYFLVLYFSSVIPTLFINAVAALSSISLPHFILLTIIGSLPMVSIFAAAGSRLCSITSVYDIFSPGVIMLFILLIALACLPMIMRYLWKDRDLTQE